MAKEECSICGTAVDTGDLHPDSLEIPEDDSEYSVSHIGCANGEDRYNGANPSDEELEDSRAWITHR